MTEKGREWLMQAGVLVAVLAGAWHFWPRDRAAEQPSTPPDRIIASETVDGRVYFKLAPAREAQIDRMEAMLCAFQREALPEQAIATDPLFAGCPDQ